MKLSEALGLGREGIYSCVGAGGKSSLLMSLSWELKDDGIPFLLSTTTKMFFRQIAGLAPVITADYERGSRYAARFLASRGYAAWVSRWRGGKVDGLPAGFLERIYYSGQARLILVEGDGARRRLLKAPALHEPVVPASSCLTWGVLNLQALGQMLGPRLVHRLELVEQLLDKVEGDTVEPRDLAILAGHSRGIFQGTPGSRVLVLAGGEGADPRLGRLILDEARALGQMKLDRCVLTVGQGRNVQVRGVYGDDL